jgi:hypothetical protein
VSNAAGIWSRNLLYVLTAERKSDKMKKKSSKDQRLLGQLEEIAQKLNLKVRYEQIRKESRFYPGGLCRVKDEDIIIINSKAPLEDKINTFVGALGNFDLSSIFIHPALRDLFKVESDETTSEISKQM